MFYPIGHVRRDQPVDIGLGWTFDVRVSLCWRVTAHSCARRTLLVLGSSSCFGSGVGVLDGLRMKLRAPDVCTLRTFATTPCRQ